VVVNRSCEPDHGVVGAATRRGESCSGIDFQSAQSHEGGRGSELHKEHKTD